MAVTRDGIPVRVWSWPGGTGDSELIRQALSGSLPPEYAGLIQQYYINIARGKMAPSGSAPPRAP